MKQFDSSASIIIDGYLFYKTCEAWPEQYDVYRGSKQVAYIRLRMGRLSVSVPDVGGEVVYYKDYKNDSAKGYFYTQEERMKYLTKIAKILKRRYKNENKRRSNK